MLGLTFTVLALATPLRLEVGTTSGAQVLLWEVDESTAFRADVALAARTADAQRFCLDAVQSTSAACVHTILDGVTRTEEAFWGGVATMRGVTAISSVNIQVDAGAPMETLYLHRGAIDDHSGDEDAAIASIISSFLWTREIVDVGASAIDMLATKLRNGIQDTTPAAPAAATNTAATPSTITLDITIGNTLAQFTVPIALTRAEYFQWAKQECSNAFEWVGEQRACETHLPRKMLKTMPRPPQAKRAPSSTAAAAQIVIEFGVEVDGVQRALQVHEGESWVAAAHAFMAAHNVGQDDTPEAHASIADLLVHEIERRASPQAGPIEEEEEEEEEKGEKEGEEESAAEAEKNDDFFVDDAEADANAEEVHEVEAPLSVSSCNVFTQTCTESHHAAQMFMMSSAEDAPETVTDASHSIWAIVAFALVVGVALSSRSSGASPEEEEEETKSNANVPTIVAATATASMRRVETPSKIGVDSSAKYVHPNAYKAGNKENVHTPAVQSRRELVSKSGEKSVAVPKWAARMVMGAGSSALVSNSGRKKEQIPSWARRMVVHKNKSGKSAKKKAGEVASSILAATASPSASSSMR